MKKYFLTFIIASALSICVMVIRQKAQAQNIDALPDQEADITAARALNATTSAEENSQIYVTKIPRGYRDWRLVSVAHEEGNLTDIRAILGNDLAIKAYRERTLPFPDGAIIARVAWSYDESDENNQAFIPFLKHGVQKSFVAGHPTNGVQFMVKDSRKYAATGGWGYAHFNDGKAASDAFMQSCLPCHQAIKSRDYIFTRYAH